MKKTNLEAMSVDDLWSLHEEISRILSARITSEKRELEKRLAILNRGRETIERGDAAPSLNADGKPEESIRGFFRNIAILRCHPRHGQDAGSSRAGWSLRYNPAARSMTSRLVHPVDRRAKVRGHKFENARADEMSSAGAWNPS